MKKLKLIKQTNEQKDNEIVSLRTWKTGAKIKIGPMKTKRSKRKCKRKISSKDYQISFFLKN